MTTSKLKDIATQGARGWAAGLAGLPGDLEGLARMLIKYGASPGSYVDRNMSETPVLPTSAFYNEWLPGGDWETPEGGVAQAIGTALGGVGATTLAKPIVKAGDLAAKYGVPLAEKAVHNAMVPSTLSKQAGVIKAPGGNWLNGSVEDSLKGLKKPEGEFLAYEQDPKLINSWIDKQLTKYVKNDMATERDPVRALAERGVLHVDPAQVHGGRSLVHPSGEAIEKLGVSDAAKAWENASDRMIASEQARTFLATRNGETGIPTVEKNPWLAKVLPETPVYDLYHHTRPDDLGFDHLIDELRNATNPASGLPRELLLKPEALERVTVPQAVERVARINEWRAAQKAEADMAKANNAATVLYKEYPEAGMKWVELKAPKVNSLEDLPEGWKLTSHDRGGQIDPILYAITRKGRAHPEAAGRHANTPEIAFENFRSGYGRPELEDALKYEGDTMGHCVGGYCEDVASGASRIFSLRDAKGQPHVTIEATPARSNSIRSMKEGQPPDFDIVQIKGKGNKKPNDAYLPYVQDFVKSGKWRDVGDLQNSGLRRFEDVFNENEIKRIRDAGIDIPTWASSDEIKAIGDKVWPGQYGNPPGKYAQGGLVNGSDNYDPMLVDALAAELESEFA